MKIESLKMCLACKGKVLCKSGMAQEARKLEVAFCRKIFEDGLYFESKGAIDLAFCRFIENQFYKEACNV